jgi:hypothetical protein
MRERQVFRRGRRQALSMIWLSAIPSAQNEW